MKRTVVFGFLGTTLDRMGGVQRWSKWRPTVALCQQHELVVSRFELLVDPRFASLARSVVEDIRQVSPETEVRLIDPGIEDPWDFQEVYERLYDWVEEYAFDVEREEYLVHLTTGTHVAQICWFLLTEARFIPGRLVQTSPSPVGAREGTPAGRHEVIDLDLSKYDRLATRLAREQERTLDFLKSGIATRSPRFNALIREIELVAVESTAPILLTGPTGAGKSMLAGRIFDLRVSRTGLSGRFVEVNCATLRGDHAMSTLFGHRRGAFTGRSRTGPDC